MGPEPVPAPPPRRSAAPAVPQPPAGADQVNGTTGATAGARRSGAAGRRRARSEGRNRTRRQAWARRARQTLAPLTHQRPGDAADEVLAKVRRNAKTAPPRRFEVGGGGWLGARCSSGGRAQNLLQNLPVAVVEPAELAGDGLEVVAFLTVAADQAPSRARPPRRWAVPTRQAPSFRSRAPGRLSRRPRLTGPVAPRPRLR